ncbi:hypothetical protein GQ44DRAFT_745001 [Phaeosphaeriaceae sp. PMI808]|nr:hypothetical protein GQ44DRAFT_745001 [Phaeosphaeriaceae sp. PMI808]
MATQELSHWLTRYANNAHAWSTTTSDDGRRSFSRPLGLIETSFDMDSTNYGGRADMTASLKLEIKHKLSSKALRRHISLAWTLLRLEHVLLMSKIDEINNTRHFAIELPHSPNEAITSASNDITWLEDHAFNSTIDPETLHHHALNVARITQPQKCLSKLHVLPLRSLPNGTVELNFLLIIAHQISDGLSAYNWFKHFLSILNSASQTIEHAIEDALNNKHFHTKLPPAQEDMYPIVPGNIARKRWFWALIRVLRFRATTMSRTFVNPLRRERRLDEPLLLAPIYAPIFNYEQGHRPPLTTGHITAALSASASKKLITLCREANVSIGAGCFALAGLSMMEIYASDHAHEASPPAFAASFPLNPRAFFREKVEADSCMLAFSEGIVMPFLPLDVPIEDRFRLVARRANAGLGVYQKRLKNTGLGIFDKRSSNRLLATAYLTSVDRLNMRLGRTEAGPQGELKPPVGEYAATCGVSSVGSTAGFFKPGTYDVSDLGDRDFAADFRGLKMGVRARENEFLVGSSTNSDGIVKFGVSYDMNAVSEEAAQNWAKTIKGLLEKGDGSRL